MIVALFWLVATVAVIPWFTLTQNSVSTALWTSIGSAVFLAILADRFTRRWRSEFRASVRTVGAFAEWITAHKSDFALPSCRAWTRDQVRARVKEIVIEHLGCEEQYREDALFVEDLGLDLLSAAGINLPDVVHFARI